MPPNENTALCGPRAESTALGGFVPRTEDSILDGLPPAFKAFHDFRTHEPRIRIDGLSAPPGIVVARVSASVVISEGCTGRGSNSPAADTVFASVSAIIIRGGTGSAETLTAATTIAEPNTLPRSSIQEADSTATAGLTVSVFDLLGTPARPSANTRRRTVTATGDATLPWNMDSGPAAPLDHLPGVSTPHRESRGRGRPRRPPRSPAHALLDHTSLSFNSLLPPWHNAHVAHAGADLLVGWHEYMHPVVASPLLEVPSAETPTADCPLAKLSIPPEGPGVDVSVDYFGPLPGTSQGNTYILLFTDCFSRRADMFLVTAAEITAEGIANILVNQYIPL